MAATTPTGSRTTSEWPTFSSKGKSPSMRAYMPKVPMGEPAWIIAESFSGMPTSPEMVRAMSSARAFSPSWIFFRKAARSATGVAAQPSKARRAAATAACTSA